MSDECLGTRLKRPAQRFHGRECRAHIRPGRCLASIEVGQRIQDEDTGICASVQRGLGSRAYRAGRLSAQREAGENLFHRLLAQDLRAAAK